MQWPRHLALVGVLCLAPALHAQERPETGWDAMRVHGFLGAGGGPANGIVVGVDAAVPVTAHLALRAEYSYWAPGFLTGCLDSHATGYGCYASGGAVLAGLRAGKRGARFGAHAGVSAGAFARDRVIGFAAPAAGAEAGVGYRLNPRLAVRVDARFLHVFDRDWEALRDHKLHFIMGTIGLEYAVNR